MGDTNPPRPAGVDLSWTDDGFVIKTYGASNLDDAWHLVKALLAKKADRPWNWDSNDG